MKGSKDYLHSILDALIMRVIQSGESREKAFSIPFYELADEYKHYKAPQEADLLDIVVTISVNLSDKEEIYDTGTDFTVERKTRH